MASSMQEKLLSGLFVTGALAGSLWLVKWFNGRMNDTYSRGRQKAQGHVERVKKELGLKHLVLDEYEELLAEHVVLPTKDSIFDHIYGRDDLVADMKGRLLGTLRLPADFHTTLWSHPKGVLLHGPPGTGKTMLAKALAQSAKCRFLNITASSIISKWLGDANRFVRATFSLAAKLAPCIIFIDEVDALLGRRGGMTEHDSSLLAKNEFMAQWDGMDSDQRLGLVVVAATNRQDAVDAAALRRFTLQFPVELPNAAQRKAILLGYLRKHFGELDEAGVAQELLSADKKMAALDEIVRQTDGFSCSDLKDLCMLAAMRPLGERLPTIVEQLDCMPGHGGEATAEQREEFRRIREEVRDVTCEDMRAALREVKVSVEKRQQAGARSYPL